MKHLINYNSQRDNISFAGKFPGFWQCFTTCSWMLMSYYSKSIDATDDNGLASYLDDVEMVIGKPGIGEKIRNKYSWIKGHTSEWWLVQKAGIEEYLWRYGVKGSAIFCDQNVGYDSLRKLIDKGPVILGTDKLGGLKGGHIILAVGYNESGIICLDPYGNALKKYQSANGAYILYPDNFLRIATGEKIRCMYWSGV